MIRELIRVAVDDSKTILTLTNEICLPSRNAVQGLVPGRSRGFSREFGPGIESSVDRIHRPQVGPFEAEFGRYRIPCNSSGQFPTKTVHRATR